ncbi:MAG: baseplate tail-tube junction protein [Culicoidibacterales bacterium]
MAIASIISDDTINPGVLTNKTNNQSGIRAFQYPLTINGAEDRHPNYLVFYAVKPKSGATGLTSQDIDKRASASVNGKFNEETLCVIQMYMPNMVENISHSYDDNDGGFLQDLVQNFNTNIGQGQGMLSAGGEALIDTAVDKVTIEAKKLSQEYNAQITGNVLGSRSASMFKNTQLRQQNFIFQFRPRNLAELKQVGLIIKEFMVNSSATNLGQANVGHDIAPGSTNIEVGGTIGTYNKIEVPPLWFVEERINRAGTNSANRYTPKFAMGPASITSVRINKTPDQTYDSFDRTAGDPIAIDLEITLQELRPVYSDYWKALTSNLGGADNGELFFGSYGSGVK